MQATRRAALRKAHLFMDALLVIAAMLLAFGVHALLRDHIAALKQPPRFSEYAVLAYGILPLWLALIVAFGLHRSFERAWSRVELLAVLLKFHVAGLFGLAFVLFLTQGIVNRSLVGLFLASSFVLMYFVRAGLDRWVRFQHERGHGQARVLLVGEPSERMREFVHTAQADPLHPWFLGYLDATDGRGETPAWIRRAGPLGQLDAFLHDDAIDQVVFFPPYNRPEAVPEAVRVCEILGVPASFAVDMEQLSRAVPRIAFLYGRPFVSLDVAPKRHEALAVKHAVDLAAAALGLLLLSPLLLATAVAIWATMGRPILFSQPRAGLYGRQFRMLKFRTMVKDAEQRRDELAGANEMTGPVFKVTGDPRITPLGSLLRKTSLDELPQLINVLLGQMSLVGPRPLPTSEQQQIRGWQRRRLSMRPGITGLWQVSGRNDVDFDEWMALDLRYVDEWSLGMDVRILLKTIPTVLFGRGAK